MPKKSKSPLFTYLGGKTRRYRNNQTGETISRRQYDKQYGSLAEGNFSSYEKKSKAASIADENLHFARPARNRKSLLKLPKEQFEHEIIERKLSTKKKHKPSPTISTKLLKKGRKSAKVNCDWSYEEIQKVIHQINNFPENVIFAYLIGCVGVDDNNNEKAVSVLPFTYYNNEFTEQTWQDINERVRFYATEAKYPGLTPLYAWVLISFDEIYYKAKNSTVPKRKRKK